MARTYLYLDCEGPYTRQEIADKIKVAIPMIGWALKRRKLCAGHVVSRTKVPPELAPDRRPRYKIYIDGKGPVSKYRVAMITKSCDSAITYLLKSNRHVFRGHYISLSPNCPPGFPKEWNGRIPNYDGRHVIVDNVEYNSAGCAARELGVNGASLKNALEITETFKGHSIAWAEEE